MYCKKYSADIPEKTCIARQKAASGKGGWGSNGSVIRDPGCLDCEQGKQIIKKQGGKMEAAKEKNIVEERRVCSLCGIEKDVSEFHADKRLIGGYKKVCKICVSERRKERKKLKREANKNVETLKMGTSTPVAKTKYNPSVKSGAERATVFIDFQDHLDIFQAVNALAKTEFRTPEAQILYFLSKQLIVPGGALEGI